MDSQKLKEIISKKYKLECEKASHPQNKSLDRYLSLPISPSLNLISLIFRGNDKYNFSSRLSDKDLILLCNSLQESVSVIKDIDFSYNHLGNDSAKELAKLLAQCENLESLNLQGNDIESTGAQAISEALQENKCIQYLNLSFNRIKTDGAMAIVELLFTNKTIKELNLGIFFRHCIYIYTISITL